MKLCFSPMFEHEFSACFSQTAGRIVWSNVRLHLTHYLCSRGRNAGRRHTNETASNRTMTEPISEQAQEDTIANHLTSQLYVLRPAAAYDKSPCVDGEPSIDFIQTTQPKVWGSIARNMAKKQPGCIYPAGHGWAGRGRRRQREKSPGKNQGFCQF